MLALKIHKNKRPNTNHGTFWIPIVDWGSAKIHLRNWSKLLANYKVKYITLIRIPKHHPVFFAVDYTVKEIIEPENLPQRGRPKFSPMRLPFVPLESIDKELLATLKPLTYRLPEILHHVGQHYSIIGPEEIGHPLSEYPELILGEDLPKSCIKWTKDIKLLIRGDKRDKLRKKSEQRTKNDDLLI